MQTLREKLLNITRKLHELGLNKGASGNVSVCDSGPVQVNALLSRPRRRETPGVKGKKNSILFPFPILRLKVVFHIPVS